MEKIKLGFAVALLSLGVSEERYPALQQNDEFGCPHVELDLQPYRQKSVGSFAVGATSRIVDRACGEPIVV